VGLLENLLTANASSGRGIGLETQEIDRVPALYAVSIASAADPHQGLLDLAHFPDMQVDDGQTGIDQQIRDRLLLQIVDLTRELDVTLIIGFEQLLANDLLELVPALPQSALELVELVSGEGVVHVSSFASFG
jgi:hypothetical protein